MSPLSTLNLDPPANRFLIQPRARLYAYANAYSQMPQNIKVVSGKVEENQRIMDAVL